MLGARVRRPNPADFQRCRCCGGMLCWHCCVYIHLPHIGPPWRSCCSTKTCSRSRSVCASRTTRNARLCAPPGSFVTILKMSDLVPISNSEIRRNSAFSVRRRLVLFSILAKIVDVARPTLIQCHLVALTGVGVLSSYALVTEFEANILPPKSILKVCRRRLVCAFFVDSPSSHTAWLCRRAK